MILRPVLWLGLAYITGEILAWLYPGRLAIAAAAAIGVSILCGALSAGGLPGKALKRRNIQKKKEPPQKRIRTGDARKKTFWRGKSRPRTYLLCLLPVFLLGGYGNYWAAFEDCLSGDKIIGIWSGENAGADDAKQMMTGTAVSVEEKENSWYVIVKNCSPVPADALLVTISKADAGALDTCVLPGYGVIFSGEIQLFEHPDNEGVYDAWLYYHSRGIDARVWADSLTVLSEDTSLLHRGAAALRRRIKDNCGRYLDGTAAGVAAGMVCGDKSMLDSGLKELYQLSGISHILAISGLHISFVGTGIYQLLKKLRLPQRASILTALLLMTGYGWFTGMAPSTVRAVVMSGMSLAGKLAGRTYDRLTALSVAALVILLPSPLLITQPGFFLSFIAAGSLILCPPGHRLPGNVYGKGKKAMAKRLAVRLYNQLAAPVYVTAGMLPAVAWCFFEVPVYSIFVNLAVIPLMNLVYPAMLAGALLGPWLGAPGFLLWRMIEGVLAVYEGLCRLSMMLPGAVQITGRPPVWVMVCAYGLLLTAAAWHTCSVRRQRKKRGDGRRHMEEKQCHNGDCLSHAFICAAFNGIGSLMALMAIVLVIWPARPEQMTVTMVNVGQGDCFLIQLPDGKNILVDGGSTDEKQVGKYTLIPFLKSRGIRSLDAVFLSHMDTDHISGVKELLEEAAGERDNVYAYDGSVYAGSVYAGSVYAGSAHAEIVHAGSVYGNGTAKRAGTMQPGSIAIRQLYMPWNVRELGGGEDVLALAQTLHIPCFGLKSGDVLTFGRLSLSVLSPQKPEEGTDAALEKYSLDRNDESLVFIVSYGAFDMLFTGDAGQSVDEALVAGLKSIGIGPVDVLKVAHHGSRESSSAELLEYVRPALALISCGADNSYGHPHKELLERLSKVTGCIYISAKNGEIIVETDGNFLKTVVWTWQGRYNSMQEDVLKDEI